jgi:hypothetical protein
MGEQVVSRQYVTGTGVLPGYTTAYCPTSYAYDLALKCPSCTYWTQATVQAAAGSLELVVTQDGQYIGGMVTTVWYLQDATGIKYWAMQHQCTNPPAGGWVTQNIQASANMGYPHVGYSSAELDFPGWMRRIEARLNDRLDNVDEIERLRGLTKVMHDKVEWLEQELELVKARNLAFVIQLRKIHDLLDCPCELPLDGTDLLDHLIELHVVAPF